MGKNKSHTKRNAGSNDASSSKKSDLIAVSGLGISSLADDSNVCAVVDEGECAPSSSSAPTRDSGVVIEKDAGGFEDAVGSSNRLSLPNYSENENLGKEEHGGGDALVENNGIKITADAPSSLSADERALTDDTPFIGNLSIELNDDNESEIKNNDEGSKIFLAAPLSDGHDIMHQPSSMIAVQHSAGMHEWNNSDTPNTMRLVSNEESNDNPIPDDRSSSSTGGEDIVCNSTLKVGFDESLYKQQPRALTSNNVDKKRVVTIDEGVTNIGEEQATSDKRKIVRFASALEEVISSFARIDTEVLSGSETRVQWSSVLIRYILNRSCCCKVDRHDGTT